MVSWSFGEHARRESLERRLAEAVENGGGYVVDTITVSEDMGGPFASYQHITLNLWADGSVTWSVPEVDSTTRTY